MDEPWIEIAAGLVFFEGRLLITQRKAGSHLAHYWEFPGGKRKEAESLEETVRREISEEVGIEVEVERMFQQTSFQYPERKVSLSFYLCRTSDGRNARAVDVADLAWVTRETLANYHFPDGNVEVMALLQQFDWPKA